MPRGRQSLALDAKSIERLKKFANLHVLSLPALREKMAAPFGWEVLARALRGGRIWTVSHAFILEWLDKNAPGKKTPKHEKTAEDFGAIGIPFRK
jgi:hypothetical protein